MHRTRKTKHRVQRSTRRSAKSKPTRVRARGARMPPSSGVTAPVATSQVVRVVSPAITPTATGHLLTHSELVGTVSVANGNFTKVFNMLLNPGNTIFRMLSKFPFQWYRFRRVSVHFNSGSPTSEKGKVYMCFIPDAIDEHPSTIDQLSQVKGATSGPVWASFSMPIPGDRLALGGMGGWRHLEASVLAGPVDPASGLAVRFAGQLLAYVAGSGVTSDTKLGELWIDYEVELKEPTTLATPEGSFWSKYRSSGGSVASIPSMLGGVLSATSGNFTEQAVGVLRRELRMSSYPYPTTGYLLGFLTVAANYLRARYGKTALATEDSKQEVFADTNAAASGLGIRAPGRYRVRTNFTVIQKAIGTADQVGMIPLVFPIGYSPDATATAVSQAYELERVRYSTYHTVNRDSDYVVDISSHQETDFIVDVPGPSVVALVPAGQLTATSRAGVVTVTDGTTTFADIDGPFNITVSDVPIMDGTDPLEWVTDFQLNSIGGMTITQLDDHSALAKMDTAYNFMIAAGSNRTFPARDATLKVDRLRQQIADCEMQLRECALSFEDDRVSLRSERLAIDPPPLRRSNV